MRKTYILVAAALLAVSALSAQTKVGYIDIDKVTRRAKQIKTVFDEIQGKMEGLQKDIKAKTQKITELRSDIKKNDGVLAKDEMDKRRKEVSKLEGELQELDYQARREMQKIDDTKFDPLMRQINYAIQDIAKEKGIDIVLRGEAVLYGVPSVDITEEVVRKLDADGVKMEPADATESSSRSTTSSMSAKEARKQATTQPDEPKATPQAKDEPAEKPQPTASPAPEEKPKAAPSPAPEEKAKAETAASEKKTETKPAATAKPEKKTGTRPVDRQND